MDYPTRHPAAIHSKPDLFSYRHWYNPPRSMKVQHHVKVDFNPIMAPKRDWGQMRKGHTKPRYTGNKDRATALQRQEKRDDQNVRASKFLLFLMRESLSCQHAPKQHHSRTRLPYSGGTHPKEHILNKLRRSDCRG